MRKSFSIRSRFRSIRFALSGLFFMLRSQHNAWIHACASVVVCAAGLWFGLTGMEWCCLIFAMTCVWTAEALNTALECLADAAAPDHHPLVGRAKDVAAAAVLIAAIASVIVGVLVFWPHVLQLFRK